MHCFCFDDAYLPLSRVGGLEDWTLLQEEGVLLITSFGLPATLSHLSFGKKYSISKKKLSKKKASKIMDTSQSLLKHKMNVRVIVRQAREFSHFFVICA